MRALRSDIDAFARRYNLRSGIETAAVLRVARESLRSILPAVLHDEVKPEAYKEGILYISVPTGSPRATLQHYRQAVLTDLKKRLGRAIVERLVVRDPTSSAVDPQV